MKGISTIVATILMLAITIALAGTSYLYISGALTSKISTSFSLVYSYTSTVTIRNDGVAPITSFTKVTVDGKPVSYSVSAQDSSLVGYWKFDELDRTTAIDSSGRGNTGTFTGETWNDGTISGAIFTSGNYGNGLNFDGVDDYVSIGSIGALTSLTVEGWMYYTTSAIDRTVFGSTAPGEGRHISLRSNGFELQPNGAVSTAWIGIPSVSANTWHHLALTWNGTTLVGYLDGVYQGYAFISGALDPAAVNAIGRQGGSGWYMPGLIDEVRIYNRTLSLSEITASMNSRYPVNRTIASYSFEEGSGNIAYDMHNVVAGKYNRAMSFDGANDYVNNTNGSVLSLGDNDFAVMGWFKRVNGTVENGQLISKFGNGPSFSVSNYEIYWGDYGANPFTSLIFGARWTYAPGSWCTISSNTVANNGVWYHFALVHSLNNMIFYVNGAQTNSGSDCGTISTVTNALEIGRRNNLIQYFNGTIDEVKIYNRALTAEEVSALYTTTIGDVIFPGTTADVKILDTLSPGTRTVRICTPSMCNTAYLIIF